jgi:hypothetical protein
MPKLLLKNVRASYCHVFEPHRFDGQEPKYTMAILIRKNDTELIHKINKAIEDAKQELKVKCGGKMPPNPKLPLRDGDVDKADQKAYVNHYWVNANSKNKPQIVDRKLKILDSEDDFYSGCYCNVTVNFYPYSTSGNKGVAVGLNNIQKLRDGERLDGKSSAFDDFEEEEDFMD